MKDCQKILQPNITESVIGKLMGFDELHTQEPFREKHRVLSESYFRNVASVGIQPGSLVATGRSRSTKNSIVHEVKGNSGISEDKKDNVFNKCIESSASKVKKGIRNTKYASASRHVLRYPQKHEHNSLGINYMRKPLEFFRSGTKDEPRLFSTSISAIKPMSNHKDVKLNRHSRPGYREHRRFVKESGKDHQLAYKEPVVNEIVSSRHSCIACTRTMSRICRQERCKSKFDVLSRTGYMGDEYIVDEVEGLVLSSPAVNDFKNPSHGPHCLLDQSSLADESRKQKFKRCKTEKEVQEVGVRVRGQNLDKMLDLADKKSMPRNGLCSLSSLQSRNSGSSSPSVHTYIHVWEDGYLKSLPLFKFKAIKEAFSSGKQDESTARDNYSKEQTISPKDVFEPKGGRGCERFPGVNDTTSPSSKMSESSSSYFSTSSDAYIRGVPDETDNDFENDRCKVIDLSQRNSMSPINNFTAQCINDATYARADAFHIEKSEHSLFVQEVSGDEAFLNEYSEEESAYSNCSKVDPPAFHDNLKRTYQKSPDSVLEQFDIQKLSNFEHFDSIGLQLQLQALNFDLEETYSESSVMLVSGDEDFDERIDDDGRIVKTWLGDNKSSNYSYMVDVLDEAGIFGMESFMDFKTWYSLECPISPSVFEALEKKYGKQTSWQKSQRRLLFDCINSGLISIFNPVINFYVWATSIRSRFYVSLRRDEVEDELWMILSSHEKEKSKDLSEKAFDKWFEIEECINIICGELESTLFDELMMEVASLWS